jgi:hypothetical protein
MLPFWDIPRRAKASAAAVVTLIYDILNDVDATSLDAHAIAPTNTPATAWTERNGNWAITSNQAMLSAGATRAHATLDAGVADCTISVTARSATTNTGTDRDAGITARWTNTSNYWKIGTNAAADLFRIVERNAATDTSRASASVVIGVADDLAIVTVLSGATISATLAGGSAISYGSATLNQTVTVHGMLASAANDRLDNFTVTVP